MKTALLTALLATPLAAQEFKETAQYEFAIERSFASCGATTKYSFQRIAETLDKNGNLIPGIVNLPYTGVIVDNCSDGTIDEFFYTRDPFSWSAAEISETTKDKPLKIAVARGSKQFMAALNEWLPMQAPNDYELATVYTLLNSFRGAQ